VRLKAAALWITSFFAAAIAVAAETQVPLDHAGRVQRIDAALAHRIKMFTDRPDFQDARLFQLADSSYVLEITSLAKAGLSRDRIPLTAMGADSLRTMVTTALAEHRTAPVLDSSGRPLFVATTTATCFGFYGWAVPYLFMDGASSEAVTGTYLLISSGGTFIPLYVTRNRPVSMGASLMSWYGMSRGALHGALLPYVLSDDPGNKAPVGGAFALSIVEGIAGFEWASRSGMTEGRAATINNLADFGTLYGLGFADLADANRQTASAATLAGAGAGLAIGALYARGRDHTYGDASVMRTAGWVGGYLALSIEAAAAQDDWSKSTTAAAMVGSAAGLVVGHGLVKRTDFSFGQGVMVDLCTASGWLFGLGTAYLASSSGGLDESVFWLSTGVGTVAGYAVGYGVSAKSARRAAADRTSWRLDVVPVPPARRGQPPGISVAMRTTFE
jgi:hypothetical protein